LDPAQSERWRERVQNVLNARDWHPLQARGEFFDAVLNDLNAQSVESEISDGVVERAVMRHYCARLWEACGSGDLALQQHALTEVWTYLRSRAFYRVRSDAVADDVTQQALVKVWEKRGTCEDPGAFLGWADRVLLNVVRDRFRSFYKPRETRDGTVYERRELELEAVSDEGERDSERLAAAGPNLPDPVETAMQVSMQNELIAALWDCLRNERHVNVIVERFLRDKSFAEVGAALHATAINVQVMTSRAMAKLRECPEMKRMYAEWLN